MPGYALRTADAILKRATVRYGAANERGAAPDKGSLRQPWLPEMNITALCVCSEGRAHRPTPSD